MEGMEGRWWYEKEKWKGDHGNRDGVIMVEERCRDHSGRRYGGMTSKRDVEG